MANGTTEPIDQIKVGNKIENSVPGQRCTQVNTVTAVIVTHTDHDFVDVSLIPVSKGDSTPCASLVSLVCPPVPAGSGQYREHHHREYRGQAIAYCIVRD